MAIFPFITNSYVHGAQHRRMFFLTSYSACIFSPCTMNNFARQEMSGGRLSSRLSGPRRCVCRRTFVHWDQAASSAFRSDVRVSEFHGE